MTVLLKDDFSGSGSLYGRIPDAEDKFLDGSWWYEDQGSGFISGGYMRTSSDSYLVGLHFNSYTTTASYIDDGGVVRAFDTSVDQHEVHIRVTRLSGDAHDLIVKLESVYGADITEEAVLVNPTIGVPTDVVISVPMGSGVGRYSMIYSSGTGIDMFAITTPGHAFVEPERGKTWTRHMKTVEVDA